MVLGEDEPNPVAPALSDPKPIVLSEEPNGAEMAEPRDVAPDSAPVDDIPVGAVGAEKAGTDPVVELVPATDVLDADDADV